MIEMRWYVVNLVSHVLISCNNMISTSTFSATVHVIADIDSPYTNLVGSSTLDKIKRYLNIKSF